MVPMMGALLLVLAVAKPENCSTYLHKEEWAGTCSDGKALAACEKCVDTHLNRTKSEHHCTHADVAKFCAPSGPPGPRPGKHSKCATALTRDCGSERTPAEACEACVEKHTKSLLKDNCTEAEVVKFCRTTPEPPSPPSPPSPSPGKHSKCGKALARECEDEKTPVEACEACVDKHHKSLLKDNCTEAEVVKFCGATPSPPGPPGPPGPPTPPGPPGPAPPPSGGCNGFMNTACTNPDYVCFHSVASCESAANQSKATSHGCTAAAVSAFCHAANPLAKCEKALEKACLNQQGAPGCVACITKNTKGLTTAGCSKAAMVEFCAGP